MAYSPLAIKRSQVLGDLYKHCEPIENIPVYLNDSAGELLGHADQSLGHYADAFSFHLPEDICKKLSTGHYNYTFDYEVFESEIEKKNRVRLNHIILTGKVKPTA